MELGIFIPGEVAPLLISNSSSVVSEQTLYVLYHAMYYLAFSTYEVSIINHILWMRKQDLEN